MKYTHFEAVYVAHFVIHLSSRSILVPVIQPRARRIRQRYQERTLPSPVAFFAIKLIHPIQIRVGVRIVEPMPKQRGQHNLDGRKTHVFHLGQRPHISKDDGLGIDIKNARINICQTCSEFLLEHFRYSLPLFGKVETEVTFAPRISKSREAEPSPKRVGRLTLQRPPLIVVEVLPQHEVSQRPPMRHLDPVLPILPHKVQERTGFQCRGPDVLLHAGMQIDHLIGYVLDLRRGEQRFDLVGGVGHQHRQSQECHNGGTRFSPHRHA